MPQLWAGPHSPAWKLLLVGAWARHQGLTVVPQQEESGEKGEGLGLESELGLPWLLGAWVYCLPVEPQGPVSSDGVDEASLQAVWIWVRVG